MAVVGLVFSVLGLLFGLASLIHIVWTEGYKSGRLDCEACAIANKEEGYD